MASARSDPPGSLVTSTRWPRDSTLRRNRSICVDLPAPSPPSKVMKYAISTAVRDTRKSTPHPSSAEFEQPIPGSLTHRADRDVIACVERDVEGLNVTPHHLEARHLGALLHRSAERTHIDDPRGELVAAAAGHEDADRLRGDKGNGTARPAEDLGLADRVVFRKELSRLEGPEPEI